MPEPRTPNACLPRICILGTGGTIAGAAVDGLGYQSGRMSIDGILTALPDVSAHVALSAEQVANVGSQTINYMIWAALAQRIQTLADSGGVDGIVITHGTDTLEETAYFLSLTVRASLPIVLTGAMRPAHALGADGPANVRQAIAVAADPLARDQGVLVLMNERIYAAREVQKMAANGLDAFAAPNWGPVGRVQGVSVVFHGCGSAFRKDRHWFAVPDRDAAPSVLVLYSHGDLDEQVVQAMLALQPAGLVLAGVGDGNTTDAALRLLSAAAARGMAIVRSSRTGSGDVRRNVEVDDDRLGFIAARDLNPQKARILLMLALVVSRDVNVLQGFFDNY